MLRVDLNHPQRKYVKWKRRLQLGHYVLFMLLLMKMTDPNGPAVSNWFYKRSLSGIVISKPDG